MIVKKIIDNSLNNKKLTCIIPMRVSEDRLDAITRLSYASEDRFIPDEVAVLVIDDGSEEVFSNEIIKTCQLLNYSYIKLETNLQEFSVGRCRNYGAMYAKSKYILMQDVDLYPYNGFYRDLINEIIVQGMDDDAKHFLMVPYLFLTEEGSKEFLYINGELKRQQFIHYLLTGMDNKIEKFSCGTSANVYNRIWYLSRGGNSSDFEGWGYEDLECNTRMIRHLNFFPLPRDWQLQKYNFNSVLEYKSWKATYRFFGDMLFNKGIVFFHIWHSVSEGGTYMDRKDRNEILFKKKMADFVTNKSEPEALPDMNTGVTLLMVNNPFTFSRDIQPFLGHIIYPSPDLMENPDTLNEFVKENLIEQVMFFNPYHSSQMYNIFKKIKESGLKYWVAERGALPNSVFFDKSGFLADSDSYKPNKWDYPLTDIKRKVTQEYIRRSQNNDDSLESQGNRIGVESLRKKFGVSKKNKILFVSLQRPSDTVTRYFTSDYGSYNDFINSLYDLEKKLPKQWKLAVKYHPLEDDRLELKNSIDLKNTHIKDALDLSDCVLTYNSGVGVLSMAWMKPTLLAGNAFYSDSRINKQVISLDDIVNSLPNLKIPECESVLRFYSYLINDFYSFGEFETKAVKLNCGSRITATTSISFSMIRNITEHEYKLSNRKKAKTNWNSILFDRYRYGEDFFYKCQKDKVFNNNNSVSKKNIITIDSTESVSSESLSTNIIFNHENVKRRNRVLKLFKKFKNDKNSFFKDSKYKYVRRIGMFTK